MNDTVSISVYMEKRAAMIEAALRSSMPEQWHIPSTLRDAMEYSLMAGGKRMRPIFVLAAAEALGGSVEAALPVACAVEMIHTYSLIHDDLPAMDNDDYRRGKLTNHKVYGEAMAVLAGDALLTHAFFMIADTCRNRRIPAESALEIIAELATYAGARGMVGGQAADVEGEKGITSLEDLNYIHLRKTSDMIVFSLKAGGRIAGADMRKLQALELFGANIGLAFQIQDDILDVTGNAQKLGKALGSDEKLGKATYPYFIGIRSSVHEVERLTSQGKEAILQADFPSPRRLLELADFLMRRDH